MKFCPLCSGSSGNATYIEAGNARILVDAGLSCKRVAELLSKIGVDPRDPNVSAIEVDLDGDGVKENVMLLTFWVRQYFSDTTTSTAIYLTQSTDNGKTWSKAQYVTAGPQRGDVVFCAAPVDPGKEIFFHGDPQQLLHALRAVALTPGVFLQQDEDLRLSMTSPAVQTAPAQNGPGILRPADRKAEMDQGAGGVFPIVPAHAGDRRPGFPFGDRVTLRWPRPGDFRQIVLRHGTENEGCCFVFHSLPLCISDRFPPILPKTARISKNRENNNGKTGIACREPGAPVHSVDLSACVC